MIRQIKMNFGSSLPQCLLDNQMAATAASTAARAPPSEPAQVEASPAKGVIEGETPDAVPVGELPVLPEREIVTTDDKPVPMGPETDETDAEETVAVVAEVDSVEPGAEEADPVDAGAELGVETGAADEVEAEGAADVDVACAELDAGTAVAAQEQTAWADPITWIAAGPHEERTQP